MKTNNLQKLQQCQQQVIALKQEFTKFFQNNQLISKEGEALLKWDKMAPASLQ